MSSRSASAKTVSDAQTDEHQATAVTVERDPTGRTACPDCGGQLVTDAETSYCQECGLVVARDYLEREPTLAEIGRKKGTEYQIEATNPFRHGKSVGSTFWNSDIDRCSVSQNRAQALSRMLTQHKRYAFTGDRKRAQRFSDACKDIQLLQSKLSLPRVVAKQAARWMRGAKEERLPGGHMAWESLGAGAVLLAIGHYDLPHTPRAVAEYAKTDHERLCAAARKIRVELELDVPPVRPAAVTAVLDGFDDELDDETAVRLGRLARHLLGIADRAKIGPGTPRVTVAAAAVYAADRLTDGKALTYRMVVDAASRTVDTSESKLSQYSQRLHDTYVEQRDGDQLAVAVIDDSSVSA